VKDIKTEREKMVGGMILGFFLAAATLPFSSAAPVDFLAPQTLPAGCRLEVITVQEEVEETKVMFMIIFLFMLTRKATDSMIMTIALMIFFCLRLKRSSARLSSDQRALSSWRRTAKMSPGRLVKLRRRWSAWRTQ
jgi:hypothetical protein